jgi:hypothetical protein
MAAHVGTHYRVHNGAGGARALRPCCRLGLEHAELLLVAMPLLLLLLAEAVDHILWRRQVMERPAVRLGCVRREGLPQGSARDRGSSGGAGAAPRSW